MNIIRSCLIVVLVFTFVGCGELPNEIVDSSSSIQSNNESVNNTSQTTSMVNVYLEKVKVWWNTPRELTNLEKLEKFVFDEVFPEIFPELNKVSVQKTYVNGFSCIRTLNYDVICKYNDSFYKKTFQVYILNKGIDKYHLNFKDYIISFSFVNGDFSSAKILTPENKFYMFRDYGWGVDYFEEFSMRNLKLGESTYKAWGKTFVFDKDYAWDNEAMRISKRFYNEFADPLNKVLRMHFGD